MKNKRPDWVQGIWTDGKYKQFQNRSAFSAAASVFGGMSLEDAEDQGLLTRKVGHPFRPKKGGKSRVSRPKSGDNE